jgi:hypothetical protein
MDGGPVAEARLDCECYSGQVANSRWLRIQSVNHVFALICSDTYELTKKLKLRIASS